jgi:hypothetical protein
MRLETVSIIKKKFLCSLGQALSIPGGWGFHFSWQQTHEGGEVVSLAHRLSLPPRKYSGTHLWQRLTRLQGHSAAGKYMSMKNSSDIIGNRTRELPAFSAVTQSNGVFASPKYYQSLHQILTSVPIQGHFVTYRNVINSWSLNSSNVIYSSIPSVRFVTDIQVNTVEIFPISFLLIS